MNTVFTIPENYLDIRGSVRTMIDWAEAQGLDAHGFAVDGFHIDEAPDGTLTLHCQQFDLTADGKRMLAGTAGSDTYEDVLRYAKHPFTAAVTSVPDLMGASA